jgi:hypothetical protein
VGYGLTVRSGRSGSVHVIVAVDGSFGGRELRRSGASAVDDD